MNANSLKLINIGKMVSYDSEKGSMVSSKNLEIVIEDGKIKDIGRNLNSADGVYDCKNKLITPGFVDCHTHPVFFEDRHREFKMRVDGLSYDEIAENGGGINSSVSSLRSSSEINLKNKIQTRMDNFLKLGTTTIEAKSGYGLNLDSELKSLKVLNDLNSTHLIDIVPTFMGAHAIPSEYKKKPDEYVDYLCKVVIPEIAKQGIAEYNDVFCEEGYFNLEQTKRVLEKGCEYGLTPRVHADEFKNIGGSSVAGILKCVSADHLMKINDEDIAHMLESNVTAVLLPGTTFFLGEKDYAPYEKLKNAGLDIAIATDYNPGSCNIQSMIFIIMLSVLYMKMEISEAFYSSTYIPAKVLNRHETSGSIEVGKIADIIIWDVSSMIEIPYNFSINPIRTVIKSGNFVF